VQLNVNAAVNAAAFLTRLKIPDSAKHLTFLFQRLDFFYIHSTYSSDRKEKLQQLAVLDSPHLNMPAKFYVQVVWENCVFFSGSEWAKLTLAGFL
jgi:hypothetical protein